MAALVHSTRRGRQDGFSIIELAIVVIVLGALLTIVVPVLNRNTRRAKTTSCQTNLRTIDSSIQAYSAGEKKAPATIADLVPDHLKVIPNCPVDPIHSYSLVGDKSDPPVQARVLCADSNGRDGVEDQDHFN